jgi:formylglycine-generating enzyme required for sulfatase activity
MKPLYARKLTDEERQILRQSLKSRHALIIPNSSDKRYAKTSVCTRVQYSSSTTPVNKYAGKGDSPCGVVDLVGNVWEWCLTEYYSGKNGLSGASFRVLRGGAWGDSQSVLFRAFHRGGGDSSQRLVNWGFRIAKSS